MHPLLSIYQPYIISQILVRTLGVRVFTGLIMKKAWARLWYFCRGIDLQGRGVVRLSLTTVCQLMNISSSTLYQWLREGKEDGAFRKYSCRGNTLHIYLGGLQKLCRRLGLRSWGTVTVVPLIDILNPMLLKQHATSATIQNLQEQSRYAVKLRLSNREKRSVKIPEASYILNIPHQSSQQPVRGQVMGIHHVGASRIFTDERFIPYGASQTTISDELGISERTVRRHITAAEVNRKQIVQTKDEYQLIRLALDYSADFCLASSRIWYSEGNQGEIVLYEPNGNYRYSRPGGHSMNPDRFFTYFGHVWLYRCNLYDLDYRLTSMRASRRSYKKLIKRMEQNGVPINQENL